MKNSITDIIRDVFKRRLVETSCANGASDCADGMSAAPDVADHGTMMLGGESVSVRDFINNSFCITVSLGARTRLLQKSFGHVFGGFPRFFDGYCIRGVSAKYNITISHIGIIRMAKAMGLPYVTIFENDAYPRVDAPRWLCETSRMAPKDARILIWGYIRVKHGERFSSEIHEARDRHAWWKIPSSVYVFGAHAYTVMASAYDMILDLHHDKPGLPSDCHAQAIPNSYLLPMNLFVQYASTPGKTVRASGVYSFPPHNIYSSVPPDGFMPVEELDRVVRTCPVPTTEFAANRRTPSGVADLVDHSFCLTMGGDKYEVFRDRFMRYLGNAPRPLICEHETQFLNATTNIMISHSLAVRIAKAMKWPFVCIFEEDACPQADAYSRLTEALRDIPGDAGMVWLGWCQIKHIRERRHHSDVMTRIKAVLSGAQAWLVLASEYDDFLSRCRVRGRHVDTKVMCYASDTYALKDPIFMQAPNGTSCHGHTGYGTKYGYRRKDCPVSFHPVWECRNVEKPTDGPNGAIYNISLVYDQNNYGQRLQTFALQRYAHREFGVSVITLDGRKPSTGDEHFRIFERECMNMKHVESRGDAIRTVNDGHKICLGGDQIFNYWTPSMSELPKSRSAFSYGAGLPPDHKIPGALWKRIWNKVCAFGTREPLKGVDHCNTIDPVFLIYDEWEALSIGGCRPGGTLVYRVERGCTAELKVVNEDGTVYDMRKRPGGRTCDPREWCGLFRGMACVRTNSFHGFAFALMNRVPRIECDSMSDHRIAALCDMLHVRFSGREVVNYEEVHRNIRTEVERARIFLSCCLRASMAMRYCAYANDKRLRERSTSGGVCGTFARHVYSCGGSVYGVAFSPGFRSLQYVRTTSMDEYLAHCVGSKYSFAKPPDADAIRRDLSAGMKVMVIGVPCVINSLSSYLRENGADCERLVLVALRCRGYSHPDKLEKFVESVEARHGSKVAGVDFRPGHKSFCVDVALSNGEKEHFGREVFNDFVFKSMPMCKRCMFAHGAMPCADVVVGDFWDFGRFGLGGEWSVAHGVNDVSVYTERGRSLWNAVVKELTCKPLCGDSQDGPDIVV